MRRYAMKRDISEADIVSALERAGYLVYKDLPCDLLVHREDMGPGVFKAIETKTPRNKSGDPREDKRQWKQKSFLAMTGTPRVTSPLEALQVLGAVDER